MGLGSALSCGWAAQVLGSNFYERTNKRIGGACFCEAFKVLFCLTKYSNVLFFVCAQKENSLMHANEFV